MLINQLKKPRLEGLTASSIEVMNDTKKTVTAEIELKYCLYARKSSEADERQALSIDSQIKEMTQLAEKEKIQIVETIQESKSAKDSGIRIGYKNLIEGLRERRFNAILTWAPDRLSRNAGDLGALVDLMDQQVLIKVQTSGQTFTNTPDEKFLLMILCSQAKLENDNRSKNVKRGMRAKCATGVRPGPPPIGYKLLRGERFEDPSAVIQDEENAPFVRKAFEYLVNEKYSGRQVLEFLTEEGFRTHKGKKLTFSMMYRLLKNPYYYGEFEYPTGSGNWYKGSYTPIITKELFEKAQERLKVPPRSTWGRKQFYFNKIFKCGNCGSGVSGETHINRHGKAYSYYRCNRYAGYGTCKEKYIRDEELIKQVASIVTGVKEDSFHIHRKIAHEVEKINQMEVMRHGAKAKLTTAHEYICFILQHGNAQEKSNMLRCTKGNLVMKGGEVFLDTPIQTKVCNK